MSGFDTNAGTAALAKTLSDRMFESQKKNTKVMIDYGQIDSDNNLVMNNFPLKIPAKDYMVCRHLTERIAHIDEHTYKTRYLKPGDMVLAVRIGNEFCVVDVIAEGNKLHEGEKL